MAATGGLAGSITIASTSSAGTLHFKSWSLQWDQATVDVTAFGDGTRKKVAGILEWSGSAEFTADDTNNPLLPGAAVAIVAKTDGTRQYSGNAIVTGIGPTTQVDGESVGTCTFEGTDTLTPA